MRKVFQIVKKKRNKRRLSVLWLFLLTIELFCPAFCDESIFAVELQSQTSEITRSISLKSETARSGENTQTVTASEYQTQNQHQAVCNDECLCHATPIAGLPFSTHKIQFLRSERIPFYISAPVLSSLPPPDNPPKIS